MEKNLGKLYLISTILLLLTSAVAAETLIYDAQPYNNGMMIFENRTYDSAQYTYRARVQFTPNIDGTLQEVLIHWCGNCSQTTSDFSVVVYFCGDGEGLKSTYNPPVSSIINNDFQVVDVSVLNFQVTAGQDFCVEVRSKDTDILYVSMGGNVSDTNKLERSDFYGYPNPTGWTDMAYIQGNYIPAARELAIRAVVLDYDECGWSNGECFGTCGNGQCVEVEPGYCGCSYSTTTTTTRSTTTTTFYRGGGGGGGGGGSLGGSNRPTCYDYIKNCHASEIGNTSQFLCETDIDCGGPCDPCPSCSDGIQNQGELGIDCGGPCAPCPVVGGTTTTMAAIGEAESTSTTTTTTEAATTTTQFEAPGATGFAIGSDLGGMSIFLFLLFLLLIVIYVYRGNIFGGKK